MFSPRVSPSPQFASAVLGEHPEEPALYLWRARDRGGGRFAARHLSDLHGRLHQDGAQTQQSQFTQAAEESSSSIQTEFIYTYIQDTCTRAAWGGVSRRARPHKSLKMGFNVGCRKALCRCFSLYFFMLWQISTNISMPNYVQAVPVWNTPMHVETNITGVLWYWRKL